MLPLDKLEQLSRRYLELDDLLCRSERARATAISSRKLNKERTDIEPLVAGVRTLPRRSRRRSREDEEALADPELRELVELELPELQAERERAREADPAPAPADRSERQEEHRPRDPRRRGRRGGRALRGRSLPHVRALRRDQGLEDRGPLARARARRGGYKEVIALVSGKDVYSQLRFEGGVHRVQRVPATETQGRIHTSTATVAVLPEADDVDVQIDDKDLEISIAASGGPGGQGVNTTNSAVQIQHKPTGLIVKCQDERSQLKNKAKAHEGAEEPPARPRASQKHEAAISAERTGMVGTGERSSEDPHLQLSAEPRQRSPHQAHAEQARSHHRGRSRRAHHRAAHVSPGRAAQRRHRRRDGDAEPSAATRTTDEAPAPPRRASRSLRADARPTRARVEALTVAMALAPGVYARNRMFDLFANAGGAAREVARRDAPRDREAPRSRVRVARRSRRAGGRGRATSSFATRSRSMSLTRVVELSRVELATLRVLASRAERPASTRRTRIARSSTRSLARLLDAGGDTGNLARAARNSSAPPPGE